MNLTKFTIDLQSRIIVNITVGQGNEKTMIPYENEDGSMTEKSFGMAVSAVTANTIKRAH